MHRVPSRSAVVDLARVWPVAAAAVWDVLVRFPPVAEPVFRWGWVPVSAVLAAQVVRRHLPAVVLRRFGLLFAWWGWAAVTLFWSPDPSAGLWLLAGVGTLALSAVWAASGPELPRRMLFRVSAAGVVLAGLAVLVVRRPGPVAHLNPDRILAMTVVGLVVVGWSGTFRRSEAAMLALAGLAVTVGSGSRMASVTLLVLLLVSPALRLPRRGRLLLAAVVAVAVVAAAGTVAFQQRWFTSGEGTLIGLVTGESTLDTSGRAEVWPQIAAACSNPWLGDGAGASSSFGAAVNPGFPEPHNEFLRVWCDTGLVGAVLLAGFFATLVAAGFDGARPRLHGSRIGLVAAVAVLLLAVTDNPLTTLGLAVPVGMVVGSGLSPPR